jgi:hypothetical protein
MRHSLHSLILKQAYIYFIASVKPLVLGDGQLFSEMASRVLGCGFDTALGQAVWITSE